MSDTGELKLNRKLRAVGSVGAFKLTYTYAKGVDRGIATLMAGVSAVEDLVISNANIITVVEGNRESLCVAYTQDFNHILAGYTDAALRKYKANTAELVQTLSDDELLNSPTPVTSIQHRPISKNCPSTDSVIATYANGTVKCWNYDSEQCIYTIKEKRQTYGLSFHPKLAKFVTFGDDYKLYLYDEESRLQERVFTGSHSPGLLDGHSSRIFSCNFHPRNSFELITGGWDNVILFWDMRQPFAVRHISGVHMCGDGIAFNSTGSEILTSAWQVENPLQLWDYGTGHLIHNILPDSFNSKLYCGKFISNDSAVCGGAEPNLVRLVDLKSFGTIASVNKLPGAVYSIDYCPFKKTKHEKKSSKKNQSHEDEAPGLPKIVVTSSKRVYQIDFS